MIIKQPRRRESHSRSLHIRGAAAAGWVPTAEEGMGPGWVEAAAATATGRRLRHAQT